MESVQFALKRNCFGLPRLVFRILGISTWTNESKIYKIYGNFMMVVAFLYPWSNFHVILSNMDNFDIIVNSMFNVVGGAAAFFKLYVIIRNQARFEKILDKLLEIQTKYSVENWVKNEVYGINKKVLVIFLAWSLSFAYFCVNTLWVRITDDDPNNWKVPISAISIINITYSPNFEIAWVYQSIAIYIISYSFCFTDVLIATMIMDLAIQLKILGKEIKETKLSDDDNNNKYPAAHLRTIVKQIVLRHLSLLDLIDEFETVSNILLLLGVVGNMSMICFSVYYATVSPPLDLKALQSYTEAVLITLALFVVCYCGTEITTASQSIAMACYEMDFVGTDVSFQRDLQMVTMRCQRPTKLTVGKFTGLSITVFVWIIRNSYTYLMVLRKSNDYNGQNE